MTLGTALLFSTGVQFPLSHGLIALGLGVAVANGLFDFNTALVRARFQDSLYVKLILVKNLLAIALTGGGAFWFGSARMAMIGGIVSITGSVVAARASLNDSDAEIRLASGAVARRLAGYALPIVAANLLYLCIPLGNRALVTVVYGFSETGQFSLAYDIGSKVVQAIGSTLDVLLLQLAEPVVSFTDSTAWLAVGPKNMVVFTATLSRAMSMRVAVGRVPMGLPLVPPVSTSL